MNHNNYLLPPFKESLTTLSCIVGLREKWIGAMLDQTGRAYSGALQLEVYPGTGPYGLDATA